ncbi:hypothetical protein C8F04DRAFT_519000 [Mycena alexandri]|uniref:Uncharacterized protein n=1 Tax=Mycena alexandri TaxID=1745969 RepID=A0AAD6TIM7_9AGAR|nr:hypothetical protein C8F04DRAFT_519000 [Mycena alexandri]
MHQKASSNSELKPRNCTLRLLCKRLQHNAGSRYDYLSVWMEVWEAYITTKYNRARGQSVRRRQRRVSYRIVVSSRSQWVGGWICNNNTCMYSGRGRGVGTVQWVQRREDEGREGDGRGRGGTAGGTPTRKPKRQDNTSNQHVHARPQACASSDLPTSDLSTFQLVRGERGSAHHHQQAPRPPHLAPLRISSRDRSVVGQSSVGASTTSAALGPVRRRRSHEDTPSRRRSNDGKLSCLRRAPQIYSARRQCRCRQNRGFRLVPSSNPAFHPLPIHPSLLGTPLPPSHPLLPSHPHPRKRNQAQATAPPRLSAEFCLYDTCVSSRIVNQSVVVVNT